MDKNTFENQAGVKVHVPEQYQAHSKEKIDVELSCGHVKRCTVSAALGRKQKCKVCNPKKPKEEKEQATQEDLLTHFEDMDVDELMTLIRTLPVTTLRRLLHVHNKK